MRRADWARKVVEAYHRHRPNVVVAETNQGGEMVRDMLRQVDPALPVKMVQARSGQVPARRAGRRPL